MIKIKSIQTKLILWQILVVITILCTMYIVLFFSIRSFLFDNAQKMVRDKNFVITGWLEINNTDLNYQIEDYRNSQEAEIFIQAYDLNGNFLASSNNITEELPFEKSIGDSAIKINNVVIRHIHSKTHGDLIVAVGLLYTRENQIAAFSQLAYPISEINKILDVLLKWMILSFPLAIIIIFSGAIFLSKKFIAPFSLITQKAKELSNNLSLTKQLPVLNPSDELGKLTLTINELLDKLENSTKQQLRFVADAAHELRTPITILKGEIEVALRTEIKDENIIKLLNSNLEEINQLSSITNNLIILTRFEAETLFVEKENIDVAELIKEEIERLSSLLKAKNIECIIYNENNIIVEANKYYLGQLFYNLIDNAQKYSFPNSKIIIRILKADKGKCNIEIIDHGIGISKDDLPYIFERFYRSKNQQKIQGSGLGLSIVKAIIEKHQGSITITSTLNEGSKVEILL